METAVRKMEEFQGVGGLRDAQNKLEKVLCGNCRILILRFSTSHRCHSIKKLSEQKSEFDQNKGRTMEEISAIVTQLMVAINEKRTQLAPTVQELRGHRTQLQDMEIAHAEKKQHYDAVMLGVQRLVVFGIGALITPD